MSRPLVRNRGRRPLGALVATLILAGCVGEPNPITGIDGEELCTLDPDLLVHVLPPDRIPALTQPSMVAPDHEEAEYLRDNDRVLGVVIDGEARAYPHNILWWHEIINDRIGDTWVSISFCPLTGSGIAFDPNLGQRRLNLGVSGFLFANNLVMYDRLTNEIYGPQLAVEGRCASFRDTGLQLLPVQEMSWARWKELHPDTKTVGFVPLGYNYRSYPYPTEEGPYNHIDNSQVWYPQSVDRSRPVKERVLAIRIDDGGRGYPFGELAELGDAAVLNETVGGVPTAIFYEAAEGETAIAFDARVDGTTLTFEVTEDGRWTDQETGSIWDLAGMAVEGTHAGTRLTQREDAYVVFWFAWRQFQPGGSMFTQ